MYGENKSKVMYGENKSKVMYGESAKTKISNNYIGFDLNEEEDSDVKEVVFHNRRNNFGRNIESAKLPKRTATALRHKNPKGRNSVQVNM